MRHRPSSLVSSSTDVKRSYSPWRSDGMRLPWLLRRWIDQFEISFQSGQPRLAVVFGPRLAGSGQLLHQAANERMESNAAAGAFLFGHGGYSVAGGDFRTHGSKPSRALVPS